MSKKESVGWEIGGGGEKPERPNFFVVYNICNETNSVKVSVGGVILAFNFFLGHILLKWEILLNHFTELGHNRMQINY